MASAAKANIWPKAAPVYRPQSKPVKPSTTSLVQRMTAPALRATGARGQAIQPMICILKSNLKYLEHWVRVEQILRKRPDEEVAVWEHLVDDNSSMKVKENDRLAILGHGTTKYVGYGGHHGSDWFYEEHMISGDIKTLRKQKRLPENFKRIELLSCESGVGDKNSLAARLAKKLNYQYTVWGYRGSSFTTLSGKNRATLDVQGEQDLEGLLQKAAEENTEFAEFMREFKTTVAELESGTRPLNGELIKETVKKFASFESASEGPDSPHQILPQGRLIVEKGGGVFIKTHKEFEGGSKVQVI
jgi:hypothetical protein